MNIFLIWKMKVKIMKIGLEVSTRKNINLINGHFKKWRAALKIIC